VVPNQPTSISDDNNGHIIKLRYTPLQREYCTVEEQNSPCHAILEEATSVELMPVVCCELHSQVPLVAAAIKHLTPSAKVAYCLTDQAALPLALSDIIRQSQAAGLIDTTLTCGQAFGGQYEAINLYSGLLAAKHVAKADITIVAIGPGTPGSGTKFGHGGVAQGEALNAVSAVNGQPIAALRISFADQRPRHYGISHHSITMLEHVCQSRVTAVVPGDLPAPQLSVINQAINNTKLNTKHQFVYSDSMAQSINLHGIKVTTMGRTQQQDPAFFSAAQAAGIHAAHANNQLQ
jgi:hypothetical protein